MSKVIKTFGTNVCGVEADSFENANAHCCILLHLNTFRNVSYSAHGTHLIPYPDPHTLKAAASALRSPQSHDGEQLALNFMATF